MKSYRPDTCCRRAASTFSSLTAGSWRTICLQRFISDAEMSDLIDRGPVLAWCGMVADSLGDSLPFDSPGGRLSALCSTVRIVLSHGPIQQFSTFVPHLPRRSWACLATAGPLQTFAGSGRKPPRASDRSGSPGVIPRAQKRSGSPEHPTVPGVSSPSAERRLACPPRSAMPSVVFLPAETRRSPAPESARLNGDAVRFHLAPEWAPTDNLRTPAGAACDRGHSAGA